MAIFFNNTNRSNNYTISLKILLISTGVLSVAMMLKLSAPVISQFVIYEVPLLYNFVISCLRPPYLYLVINCIIITIVASSKIQSSLDDASSSPEIVSAKVSGDSRTEFAYDGVVSKVELRPEFAYDGVVSKVELRPEFGYDGAVSKVELRPEFGYDGAVSKVELRPEFGYDGVVSKVELRPEFGYDGVVSKVELRPEFGYDGVVSKVELRPEFGYDGVVSKVELRPEFGCGTGTSVLNNQIVEPEDGNGYVEGSVSEVVVDGVDEFVISRSSWTPPLRQDSMELFTGLNEKPPVSARFGHRKSVKSSPEAGKALRVSKPKRQDTLESTWKTITEGRAMPLTRHLRKSDTWETHNRHNPENQTPPKMKKSETFNDRTTSNNSSLSPSPGSGKLRRERSLSQDELNRRVEAFIKKFNEEMRLQRQESLNQYKEMIRRGANYNV